jgi:hypothetical protein
MKKAIAAIFGLALLGILLRAVGVDTNVIDRWAPIVLVLLGLSTLGEETRTATVMLCQDVNEIRAARNRL